MKAFVPLLFVALLATSPAYADTNINVNANEGYVSPSALSTTGTQEPGEALSDGQTAQGSSVNGAFYPTFPNGSYATVNSIFLDSSRTIDSVVFYDALWSDGGWFGVSGSNQDGTTTTFHSTLSAAALTVPILQYSTDADFSTWTTAATTNNYLLQLTGATVGTASSLTPYSDGTGAPFGTYSAPTSVPFTFTLTTPLTGVTAIRLVGPAGGSSLSEGIVSGYEFQVFAANVTPEPSTYAMFLGAMGMLVLATRLTRKLSA